MDDKRSYTRLCKTEDVSTEFAYDVRTRMTFRFKKGSYDDANLYTGAIKNISAEGLCFVSNQPVNPGEKLEILVSLPGAERAIKMDAEARWTAISKEENNNSRFDTGVRIVTVDGNPVAKSVYYDETYHVHWSIVLEAVLGRFRIMQQNRRAANDNS
jgi:hypothetical protein